MQIKTHRIILEGVTETLLRDLHMLKQDGYKPTRLVSTMLNILLSVFSGHYIAALLRA